LSPKILGSVILAVENKAERANRSKKQVFFMTFRLVCEDENAMGKRYKNYWSFGSTGVNASDSI
jgi:hypothetical protein